LSSGLPQQASRPFKNCGLGWIRAGAVLEAAGERGVPMAADHRWCDAVDRFAARRTRRRGLEVPPRLMMTCPCQGISKSSIQPIRFLAGAFASSPLHEERARIPVRAYNGDSVSRCLCPWRSRISGCVKSSGPCEPGLASKHWKIWLRRPKEARAHAHRASGRLAQSAGGAPPDDRRRYRRGLPGDEPWARSSSNRII